MTTIKTPILHRNGTPGENLYAMYEKCQNALGDAERACVDASPNARDYYVESDAAFNVAAEQHQSRLSKIREIRSEIERILESISDQMEISQ